MPPRLTLWTQRFTSREGGMGTWLEQIARWGGRSGWMTTVRHFTPDPASFEKDADLPFHYESVEIPRPHIDCATLAASLRVGRGVWKHRGELAESDLAIEIFGEPSDLKFWTFTLVGRQVRPYALVIGCRTFEDHAPGGWKKRWRNRFYLGWMQGARGILVDGEDVKRELAAHGVNADRIRVMYASVDTRRYHDRVSSEPFWRALKEQGIERQSGSLLLFCGRLHAMNRPLDFLEVLAKIPEAWGVLIGDGPQRAAVEARMKDMPGRAFLIGYQPEEILASAFRAATLCLFPLGREIAGISLVVPKAMACGAAVVTNRVADLPRLIASGENGMLCEEGDIEGWVKITKDLLAQPERAEQLGRQARLTIEADWTETARAGHYREWFESMRE